MRREHLFFVLGTAAGLFVGGILHRALTPPPERDLEVFLAVRDFVRDSFVREVSDAELFDSALRGMVHELDDYSRYYGPTELAHLHRETSGRYRGIGVVFRGSPDDAQVLFALPDSPADKAGLLVGDRVLSVDGRSLAHMQPGEFRAAVEDPNRASLELNVRGLDGLERELRVTRSVLIDPTVRHGRLLDEELGLGYLTITSFSQETPIEFDRELERLRSLGMRALVVDVRGNLGGVLSSAVQVANRFVEKGLIVSTEGRGDSERFEAESREAHYLGLPLVVLVDEESASASEVFAASVQDHRSAVVVGTPTYGKGMVQKMRKFGRGTAEVKLTTAYYYTPSHRNLERSVEKAWKYGLLPDVVVELTSAEARRVHNYLAGYSVPGEALPALRAWEESEDIALVPEHPKDPQLDAAISLFRGERPGPLALETSG